MNLASKTRPTTSTRRSSAALTGIVSLVCVMVPLAACSSSKSPAGGGTAGNIMLYDENNYSSQSTLTLNSISTKAATDQDICWTGLTQDLQCHSVDPLADIDNLSLVRFQKTHEEVQVYLLSGEFDSKKVDRYNMHHTDHLSTCAKLSEFSSIDNKAINIAQDLAASTSDINYSYVLMGATTTQPGVGSASMVFVNPLDSADVAPLDIPIGCKLLKVDADLHSLTKVTAPTQGPWVVDWSHVTKDFSAYGDYFDLTIGYSKGRGVADLEKNFFDIETSATHLWHVRNIPSGNHSAKLSLAMDDDGNPFTGFEPQDGVWAIALQCPTCQNPMPVVLTIVDTIGGDQ